MLFISMHGLVISLVQGSEMGTPPTLQLLGVTIKSQLAQSIAKKTSLGMTVGRDCTVASSLQCTAQNTQVREYLIHADASKAIENNMGLSEFRSKHDQETLVPWHTLTLVTPVS